MGEMGENCNTSNNKKCILKSHRRKERRPPAPNILPYKEEPTGAVVAGKGCQC